jgi:hypothetical protein
MFTTINVFQNENLQELEGEADYGFRSEFCGVSWISAGALVAEVADKRF